MIITFLHKANQLQKLILVEKKIDTTIHTNVLRNDETVNSNNNNNIENAVTRKKKTVFYLFKCKIRVIIKFDRNQRRRTLAAHAINVSGSKNEFEKCHRSMFDVT